MTAAAHGPSRGGDRWDVVVVGGGNAGLSAALAAAHAGGRVVVVDKAASEWAGGNSYFTAGAFRTTFSSLDDLRPLLSGLDDDKARLVDLPPYTDADFLGDLQRVTRGRADPELATVLAREARAAVEWLAEQGVRFELMFHRQAYEVGGRLRFWGGLALGVVGGGKDLVDRELRAARAAGVELRFATPALRLAVDAAGAVEGVVVATRDGPTTLSATSVVLSAGGFEANPQMRAAYLGPGWDLAVVRGTPYNTGDGIAMALAVGAQPYGHWSGCHSVAWDAGAAAAGDRELTNQLTRGGYPFGIVVNQAGRRFLDEGADFRNYTYARYGAEILKQPGSFAAQIFDAKSRPLLRAEEYEAPGATKVAADTLEDLARGLGIDPDGLVGTVAEFNAAVGAEAFDPTTKDGRHTVGITPPKSNWSLTIDSPPYLGFPVTCGITFTFGGLRIDTDARVLDTTGHPLRGLYAAGELVGGIFFHNYPGGSGLTVGTVFGRRAGTSAVHDLDRGVAAPRSSTPQPLA